MGSLSEFLAQENFFKDTALVGGSTPNLDFANKFVQFNDDPLRVASGEASILFAGPPILGKPAGDFASLLMPIGGVQGIQDGGTANVVPYREVGSKLKRAARASADYRISIGKVVTWHSNLLHAFYSWIPKLTSKTTTSKELEMLLAPGSPNAGGGSDSTEKKEVGLGHWINLDSDIFAVPFGCLFLTVTGGGEILSQEYWERCLIADLGKTTGAGQPMIQEQVSLIVGRKVPAGNIAVGMTGAKFKITTGNVPASR